MNILAPLHFLLRQRVQLHFSTSHQRVGNRPWPSLAPCARSAVLFSQLVFVENGRNSEDVDSHTLLLCQRTVELVLVVCWKTARVFRGNPCMFDHVGIQPPCEKCCNFSFSPQPLDAESGRKTELACGA